MNDAPQVERLRAIANKKGMFYFTPTERALLKIANGMKLTRIENKAIDRLLITAAFRK